MNKQHLEEMIEIYIDLTKSDDEHVKNFAINMTNFYSGQYYTLTGDWYRRRI